MPVQWLGNCNLWAVRFMPVQRLDNCNRDNLTKLLAQYHLAQEQVRQEQSNLDELEQKLEDLLSAQKVIQEVAEQVQREAHRRVASIVTRCLRAVFGEQDAYEFKINFVQRRGKTEADLILKRGDLEVSPLDAAGGGVCDILSLSLRLATLILTRPQKRKLLLLDEPCKHLSSEYRERVADLLEVLAEEMDIQFVVVTHWAEFQVGKVIRLE